jgi:parvulin-like peptidyl-prolyl isomerase
MRRSILFILITILLLAGCGGDNNADAPAPATAVTPQVPAGEGGSTENPVSPPEETPTETAVPPTATPAEPLAALVNGQPITLSTFERELARYEQAQAQLGQPAEGADYQGVVLESLIERLLINQAAEAAGIVITPETVDENLAEMRAAAGSPDAFNQWLAANQWTEAEFREILAAELAAGQIRDQVTADVPTAVEQVNARYLRVDDPELAQTLHQRALAGDDFAFLATQNSLDNVTGPNGGELGFFARNSLLVPEVETAAFALQQPGEISDVITAPNPATGETAYYIVQLIERDPQRPLTADMRYNLLQQAFQAWLTDLKSQASIELFIKNN